MSEIYNRVKVKVSGTPGTGTITLGTPVSGFQTFSQANAVTGSTVFYLIEEGTSWEIGIGTYTNSGGVETLSRTTVYDSSNDGNKISVTSSGIVISSTSKEFFNILTNRSNHTGEPSGAVAGYSSDGTIPAHVGLNAATHDINIHRFRDRVLVGNAVEYTGKFASSGDLGTDNLTNYGASYFATNAAMIVGALQGRYGLTAYAFGDTATAPTGGATGAGGIALVGVGISKAGSGYVRGAYLEGLAFSPDGLASAAEFQSGNHTGLDYAKSSAYFIRGQTCAYFGAVGYTDYTQGNDSINLTPRISSVVGNGTTATITTITPHRYSVSDEVTIYDCSIGSGGFDGTYIVTAVTTNTFSYANATVASGAATGYTAKAHAVGQCMDISGGFGAPWQKFKTGIVFRNGALQRDAGTDRADAIRMAQKYQLVWDTSDAAMNSAVIRSDINAPNSQQWLVFENHQTTIYGTGENEVVTFKNDSSGTPVNHAIIQNSKTGLPIIIQTTGTDTNIGLTVYMKGEGSIFRVHGDAGADEYLRVAGVASNVNFLEIKGSATGNPITLSALGSDTDISLGLRSKGAGSVRMLAHAGAVEVARFSANASNTVNGFNFVSYGTGSPGQIQAFGGDTNIDLMLVPKGSGNMRFGTHSALAGETVTGYITIKDAGGTTRKLAVVS